MLLFPLFSPKKWKHFFDRNKIMESVKRGEMNWKCKSKQISEFFPRYFDQGQRWVNNRLVCRTDTSLHHILIKTRSCGSPGLVVMRGGSCSEGHGFESQHHILDGHFSRLFVVKFVLFVWNDKNKRKEAGRVHFFLKGPVAVLGIRTRCRKMVSADGSTELWWPPYLWIDSLVPTLIWDKYT